MRIATRAAIIVVLGATVATAQGRFPPQGSGCTPEATGCTFTVPPLVPVGTTTVPSVGLSGTPTMGEYWSANVIEQRNGVSGQSRFIYNTYTDATNYERLEMKWAANFAYLQTATSGTGTARPLVVNAATGPLYLRVAGGGWQVVNNTERNFVPDATDTSDVGATNSAIQHIYTTRGLQGAPPARTLVDNTATTLFRVAVSDDDYEGGSFGWTAFAEDADTDARQVRVGTTHFAILNTSGTESCVFSAGDEAVNVTAGTLTCTFDCNSAVNNTIDIRATCDTSLDATAETLTLEYRPETQSITTITPLT